jgi:hypothetical protein
MFTAFPPVFSCLMALATLRVALLAALRRLLPLGVISGSGDAGFGDSASSGSGLVCRTMWRRMLIGRQRKPQNLHSVLTD